MLLQHISSKLQTAKKEPTTVCDSVMYNTAAINHEKDCHADYALHEFRTQWRLITKNSSQNDE